jgi:hypothetical protein
MELLTFKMSGLMDNATPTDQVRLWIDITKTDGAAVRGLALIVPPPHRAGIGTLGHGLHSGNYLLEVGAVYTI